MRLVQFGRFGREVTRHIIFKPKIRRSKYDTRSKHILLDGNGTSLFIQDALRSESTSAVFIKGKFPMLPAHSDKSAVRSSESDQLVVAQTYFAGTRTMSIQPLSPA